MNPATTDMIMAVDTTIATATDMGMGTDIVIGNTGITVIIRMIAIIMTVMVMDTMIIG